MRIHASQERLGKLYDTPYSKPTRNGDGKPDGLWYSFERGMWYGIDGYLEGARHKMFEYQLDTTRCSILRIETRNQLIRFWKKYKIKVLEYPRIYGTAYKNDPVRILTKINWRKACEDFDGIEVMLSSIEGKLPFTTQIWLNKWHFDSGVIWNATKVKVVTP